MLPEEVKAIGLMMILLPVGFALVAGAAILAVVAVMSVFDAVVATLADPHGVLETTDYIKFDERKRKVSGYVSIGIYLLVAVLLICV